MSRAPRTASALTASLLTAAVAAATTWVAMLSWRGFAEDSAGYLRPLLLLAAVVAASGALGRWYRVPGALLFPLQVLLSAAAACWILVGSPVPLGASYAELIDVFSDAGASANQYAPPVPQRVSPIDPLLIAGGLACLLLVDLIAGTLRRVPLAGLPLLAVFTVPVSMLDDGLSWWIFALCAAGFLALLFLHENEQIARWGRPLGTDPTITDPSTFTVRTGAARASAGAIGGVATALAIVVPLAIPTLDLHLFDFGPGSGGDDEITLENPMTDLRRDLKRDVDLDLLRVTTDDPTPSYLRISVLNRFSDEEWTSGDRSIPTDQLPDGAMPPLLGVDDTVPRVEHDYSISVGSAFRSSWLPTQAPISAITAEGDWRYDDATMDFIAGDEDLDTAGLSYDLTSVDLELDAADMAAAPPSAGLVGSEFTSVPDDLTPMARDLALAVTENATSPFERAVALQQWFRDGGGFRYSLDVDLGNGADDLEAFLTDRVGYCEQFASAMAVMAREIGIPARVAVGFLSPERVSRSTYQYSSFDLHAWPEIFIPGSGWVAFEPTPAGRASGVPSYTDIEVGNAAPIPTPSATASNPDDRPSRGQSESASPTASADPRASSGDDAGGGFPWLPVGGGVVGALLLAGLLTLPRTLRRARRTRRLDGDPETVWAELRDSAVDLGVPWPAQRSPRETREHLVGFLGDPADEGPAAERPAHGRHVAPGPASSLDRIVIALERSRYARSGAGEAGLLREDLVASIAGLRAGATPRAVRRADWWPRSLLGSPAADSRRPGTSRPAESVHGGVVDHAG
ncbi:DUF3488 and transglutaminase-like domain-containing protein [Nocardioides lianchengensis]|uniref:Transglutaminase-like superfamily protein n=1 Tax=Nocardioides lianchengensis TaxID=1045774 RepID=A0A1G6QTV2_9ACTN|nr:DUF3488 and transglutaminase-like domain-containing protein [Nocardioides lianchengensis]NYG10506.1 transglutaminase-like putative cysteine protease [Nocardioides lianchengensis]SDC95364.1 Transglutaminase-like superfamily protein [Nocardioides lianchengensis]